MVLLKAIEKASEGQQIYVKIKELVLETCKVLMTFNEEFRKNTIKMLADFYKAPEFRTADIVPSISVMLAQLFTFMQLDNFNQYLTETPEFTLDKSQLQVIFRFAFEEQMRRRIKDGTEPPSKTAILKVLFPGYKPFVDEVIEHRRKEIIAEM